MAESSNDARTRRVTEQAIRRAEGFVPRRMPRLTNDDRIAILRDGRAIDIAAARATRAAAESHPPRRCLNCETVQARKEGAVVMVHSDSSTCAALSGLG